MTVRLDTMLTGVDAVNLTRDFASRDFLRELTSASVRTFAYPFCKYRDEAVRAVVETLGRVPAFADLSRRALYDLAEVVHERAYAQDEILYYEGDPGLGLYVVHEGTVRLMVADAAGVLQPVRLVTSIELIGDLSLLGGTQRIETAQAATDVRVLGFFRPDLTTLFRRSPKTGVALLEALMQHLATRQVALLDALAEHMSRVDALHLYNATRDEVG